MSQKFPDGFVWGVAAAGHQIEGYNVDSDLWFCENLPGSVFKEPSGIACDSYNRWAEDLDIVKEIGVNTYRMSIEWSRIQPTENTFSDKEFAHYEAVIDGCIARGLKVNLTMNHFTSPHWFAAKAGWLNPEAPALFAKYCAEVARRLGDKVDYIVTFNEPNISQLLASFNLPDFVAKANQVTLEAAAAKAGVEKYRCSNVMLAEDYVPYAEAMAIGHSAAVKAIKAVLPNKPVGLSIAMLDDDLETPDTDPTVRDNKREFVYGIWLRLAKNDDFMGVQNYERVIYNAEGPMPAPEGARVTGFGNMLDASSLANCLEYAYSITGKPLMVTEHGVNSENDEDREWIITESLKELHKVMQKGVPVWGYTHWSFLDNFEWIFGYGPKFGLCSVDRKTMKRTRKPSSFVLGAIATANAV
ncbi:MAG: glycoside hydrolase family 1 protein [Micrococcales bacterium]